MKEIITYQINDIEKAAKKFLEEITPYNKFAFYGKMGAGKTTFIKKICKLLGVNEDTVNSPTFTIINEYQTNSGNIIYHCDLYRIKTLDELYNIGFEEYLYDDNFLFIEWPEIAESIYPENILKIKIEEIDQKTRKIMQLN